MSCVVLRHGSRRFFNSQSTLGLNLLQKVHVNSDVWVRLRNSACYATATKQHTHPAQKTKAKQKSGNPPRPHLPSAKKLPASQTTTRSSQVTSLPSPSSIPDSPHTVKSSTSDPSLNLQSPEDQLKMLEQMEKLERLYPTMDVWSAQLETLDVHVSKPWSSLFSWSTLQYPRLAYRKFKKEAMDRILTMSSMNRIAKFNSFPGIDLPESKWKRRNLKQLFGARSMRPTAWLAPFREETTEIYKKVCQAIAKGDKDTIKTHTTAAYQEYALSLVHRRERGTVVDWRLHAEPRVQVLSVRAAEAYLARDPPKRGNRLAVQILVQIDSAQSIVARREQGRRAQEQPPPEHVPKQVTEYWVMQKRMWYDAPWVVREEIFDS